MDTNKLQTHIDTLNDDELLQFVGEWVLSESATLGGQPASVDELKHAGEEFLQGVCVSLSKQVQHPLAQALTKPGPIGTYIDFIAGAGVGHLSTQVQIIAFAAIASRYGLPNLIKRFAKEGES